MWNKEQVSIYIDGTLYTTVIEPVNLPFESLSPANLPNYNPVKSFKTVINKQQATALYQATFTDQILTESDSLIKGKIFFIKYNNVT